jgi:hypothetical protein
MKQKVPSDNFTCSVCRSAFIRPRSSVSNPDTTCCSRKCYAERQKVMRLGTNNPNYKDGKYTNTTCVCGSRKDYRGIQCKGCAGLSLTEIDENELREAVANSNTLVGVAKLVGCSRKIVARRAAILGIDLSNLIPSRGRPRTLEQVFCRKNHRDGTTRNYLRRWEPEIYFCSKCGQPPNWEGEELVLQMDHIDGDSCNDERNNLRWLCPNCHTQTPTFTGRNSWKAKGSGRNASDSNV